MGVGKITPSPFANKLDLGGSISLLGQMCYCVSKLFYRRFNISKDSVICAKAVNVL